MQPIYLDYNATTPIDPDVAEAMKPCLGRLFGNPSSCHGPGMEAKKAVEKARGQVAGCLGCTAGEVVFTSGGTESNNHAVKGIAFANRGRGNHIIISAVEHPAVTAVCGYLDKFGFRTTILPVDGTGVVDVTALDRAITPETILISVMHANNEVGTIQPIAEIGAVARQKRIVFHCDAAQSVGKIPVNVSELGVDLLSLAGHKIYGPKGVGALFIKEGTLIDSFMHGAGHEGGRRAGTENLPEIVGLGAACDAARRGLQKNGDRMMLTRDRLEQGLKDRADNLLINGHPENRLPNTLSASFRDIDAGRLMNDLVMADIAVSAGAACHAGTTTLSPTLAAMGVPPEYARGTIRFSTGRSTREEEIDRTIEVVADAVRRLRK